MSIFEQKLHKLTKKELIHFIISNDKEAETLARFGNNRKKQREHDEKYPKSPEACWDCRMIAKKLEVE
jgi:hypothetical protein